MQQERRVGETRLLHQIPDRGQHAVLAAREHVGGERIEHHGGVELTLLGEAAQQADGALVTTEFFSRSNL